MWDVLVEDVLKEDSDSDSDSDMEDMPVSDGESDEDEDDDKQILGCKNSNRFISVLNILVSLHHFLSFYMHLYVIFLFLCFYSIST